MSGISMQSKGFIAIDRYMASCNRADSDIASLHTSEEIGDQKVPQQSLLPGEENLPLLREIKSEPQSNHAVGDFTCLLDSHVLDLAPAPSANCTYVNTVSDQQIYRDGSPTLFDLDNSTHYQDLSFYDEVAHMKDKKPNYSFNDLLVSQDIMYPNQQSLDLLEQAELSTVANAYIKQEINDLQQCWESGSDFSEDSLMERSIIEDLQRCILGVTRDLQISEDPELWTCRDVQKWVHYNTQMSFPEAYKSFDQLTGRDLCILTEMDFITLSPETGTNLFTQLDIWKNAPRSNEIETHLQSSQEMTEVKPNKRCHIEHKQTIHLWQFLRELLDQPGLKCIKWVDRSRGVFKIEDSAHVAKLWGRRKNRPKMDYDKLSRSIRQYYKKGIIRKTEHSKRLVYQFCQGYL